MKAVTFLRFMKRSNYIIVFLIFVLGVISFTSCNNKLEDGYWNSEGSNLDGYLEEEDYTEDLESDLMEYLYQEYEYVGNLSEGLILVNKDHYYGYVDEEGQLVIPLIFEKASDFKNGRAVVAPADKQGVIDKDGDYIMRPKYTEIEILDEFIQVKGEVSQYLQTADYYLLFDLDGNEIVSELCSSILIGDNNIITARIYDKENINFVYHTIIDYSGNVICSFGKDVWVGQFHEGYALFKDGKAEIAETGAYPYYHGLYTYIDIKGNKMTNDYFVHATDFENGMVVVATGICHDDGSGIKNTSWKVMDNNFETLYELEDLGDSTCLGIYHKYVIYKPSNTSGCFLINMQTNVSYGMFSSLDVIPEADAIIFNFTDTGLWGLFVNGLLKFTDYNEITYEGNGVFTLRQGTLITEYDVSLSD